MTIFYYMGEKGYAFNPSSRFLTLTQNADVNFRDADEYIFLLPALVASVVDILSLLFWKKLDFVFQRNFNK